MIRLAVIRRSRRAARVGRAFTLIEVLIAAFIISLGVMGLLALFAGAARQQQGASQITQSVFFSNSAAAILQSNLGRLSFEDACVAPEPGRWQPVHMDRLEYFLTLAGVGGCSCQESPFFLIKLAPKRLFSTNTPPIPPNSGFADGVTPPAGVQDIGTTDFNGQVSLLPGRDLDPDSIRISVSVVDTNTADGDTSRTMSYFRPPNTPLNNLYQVDNDTTIFVLPHNGVPEAAPGDVNPNYVAIDVKPCTNLDGESARLVVVSVQGLTPPWDLGVVLGSEYISEIVLEEGDRQSRDLVSLPDRLRFRFDASAEDGRRPEMSYGLLWRQKDSVMQALIMSYRLIASSGAALWVPPERPLDYPLASSQMWDDSPLRRVDLQLGYDQGLQQYYVELDRDTDAWAIEPGQILVVEGDAGLGARNAPGSDGAVRILRQLTIGGVGPNGRARGMLNRGPRHDGSSYLTGNELINGITLKLRFIAINDIVRSLEDGSDWRLRPIGDCVIQVAIN